MIIADLVNELRTCDQTFDACLVVDGQIIELTDITPQVATLDGERTFIYLLTAAAQVDPVAIDEMGEWLRAKGHNV